jgi:hypothetical protein
MWLDMKLFNLLNIALFGLCLTACGGGGGGSSQPSPQTNNNSSIVASSASSEASSDGIKESMTISGTVFNSAYIPNADIIVTVGDATFNAKTNAAGQYSVPITVSKKNLTVPIKIVATGDAQYPGTILATQLESTSKLLEQAGSDRVLDTTENPATNISNLTTAEYAFLTVPTKWGYALPISTDAELEEARQELSTIRKINVAAYLEITATDSRFKLPAAYKNTLEFAKDQASFDTFGAQVFEKDDTIIGTVSERIIKTNNLAYAGPDHAGTYILYDATSRNSYLLKLNADASGEFKANGVTTSLTWSKKSFAITLIFLTPVPTNESDYSGKWFMTGAEISGYDQYGNSSRADLLLSKSLIDPNGKTLYDKRSYLRIGIYDQAKFITPPLDKITGEWIGSEGVYQLNANGTGSFKSFALDTQAGVSWNLKDGTLSLKKDDGGVKNINFVQDLGAGYAYVKTDDKYFEYSVSQGMLIKPTKNLSVQSSEFFGSWIDSRRALNNFIYIRVMAPDGRAFADFGSSDWNWITNETKDGWTQSGYKQGDNEWTPSCDVAQGTNIDCRLFRTSTNKLIAIEGSNYYFVRTDKVYYDPANPSVENSLVLSKKIPEVHYFAPWIMTGRIMTFYHVDGLSTKVWNFSGDKLIVSDKSLASSFFSDNEITFTIKNNRLQYVRDNVALELELIKASEDGLMVCEFAQGSSCATGSKFLLSNKSPAKISLKVSGNGSIAPHSSLPYGIFPDGLFGNVVAYNVKPDAGSVVKSVTGCGGKLDYSNIYVTAEIRDACTITAIFDAIQ